jgi:DNA-binding NarL/FixJ family response regulator
MGMVRLLIVDDHAVVRRGLKEIVLETVNINVVIDEASNGQEAMGMIHKSDYDVVLMDIAMPGRNGLDVLKVMKAEKPTLPVLILSMYPEEQFALRSLRSGASGYLTKESAPEEMKKAIGKILEGGTYLSPNASELLVNELRTKKNKSNQSEQVLSDREYQVASMIALGKPLKKIAEEMFLSEKTISTYRARILEKLQIQSNAELTKYAISKGIIPSL